MKATLDIEYQTNRHVVSEYPHCYGESVHILANPVLLHLINKISSQSTSPAEVVQCVRWAYRLMLYEALPLTVPIVGNQLISRMATLTPRGVYHHLELDPEQKFVCVSLARAGIVPSQVCFEEIQSLLGYEAVWQDHFFCARIVDENGQVIGSKITGFKTGGEIQNKIVLIADPMGATGHTIDAVIQHYKKKGFGTPKSFLGLHLMVTPEYLWRITQNFPELTIVTGRLDRGLSDPDILNSPFGSQWEKERGLTEQGYIVPGAGGVGELMNYTEN